MKKCGQNSWKLRQSVAAISLVLSCGLINSAGASEIYFDFNRNAVSTPANASVFLFGASGQTATVSNNAGFSQNVTLSADGFFNLSIPNLYQQSGTGVLESGFKVVSSTPIAGYFVNRASYTTDMTYLLDSAALGKNYVVASQGGGFGEGSQVAIHATQDNTKVTFTPTAGSPVTVTLNSGETYKYAGGATNLTGSQVIADKAVAVFSGHECAQVPVGTVACDTLLEQMIPTEKLSKSYTLTASKAAPLTGSSSDLVRVIATADNTQVKVAGVVVATLNKGQFYEFSLAANSGTSVDASEVVMVAQYLKGQGGGTGPTDPAMSLVPGSDTWLKKYRLSTPSGDQNFAVDYASIVIETDDLLSLLLNGAKVDTSGCTAITGTAYSRCDISLGDGLFDLSSEDPFLVMLGGGGDYDSYFTYGGSSFAPGVSPHDPTGVPEPASLALLGLGLGGIGLARRRKS